MGRRLVRRLTGDDDDDDDDDDDKYHKCDDKDKDDGDDRRGIFGWYFNQDEQDEGLDVKSVSIHGTGEIIRIVFRSDHSVTKRGFFAKYSVTRGNLYFTNKQAKQIHCIIL